jgi:hypothetical protein
LLFQEKYGIILIIIIALWGIIIMVHTNRKEKNKRFHDSRCRKILQHLTKRNKRNELQKRFQHSMQPGVAAVNSTGRTSIYRLKAPRHLSIFDETQSAIIYFDKVLQTIQKCKFRDSILFDLSEVEIITPDAIMYLIAIIRNTRRIRFLRISCGGNMPKADSARDIIEQSGFFSFVSSTSKLQIEPDNSYMKISDGVDADGELASSFCDFVQSSSTQTVLSTKRLYPMIIELMTNTHQHAYDTQEAQTMMGNWYIFAQDTGTAIHFVFLDTGLGIPKTVLKRFYEKIKDFAFRNDAVYLKSALQGTFRSETKQGHRGKGLPGIYEDACNLSIMGLSIISGQGKCTVKENGGIETENFDQTFEGTLFTWDILKEEVLYDHS